MIWVLDLITIKISHFSSYRLQEQHNSITAKMHHNCIHLKIYPFCITMLLQCGCNCKNPEFNLQRSVSNCSFFCVIFSSDGLKHAALNLTSNELFFPVASRTGLFWGRQSGRLVSRCYWFPSFKTYLFGLCDGSRHLLPRCTVSNSVIYMRWLTFRFSILEKDHYLYFRAYKTFGSTADHYLTINSVQVVWVKLPASL